MERRQLGSWGIVVALGVAVTVLQVVAGPAVAFLALALRIAILVGLVVFGYRLWREHRARLGFLSGPQKALFYGAAAVIVLAVLGSFLLPLTLFGSIALLLLVGGCAFVMWRIFQDAAGWY